MDKQEEYTEDILSQYINPERIEKAPEGFTTKIMSIIEMEKAPVFLQKKIKRRTLVPYVFSGFIIILAIAALLLPSSDSKPLSIPALNFIRNFKITLPEVDFGSLFSIDIPSAFIYGIIGILLLALLDKALYGVFHREK